MARQPSHYPDDTKSPCLTRGTMLRPDCNSKQKRGSSAGGGHYFNATVVLRRTEPGHTILVFQHTRTFVLSVKTTWIT